MALRVQSAILQGSVSVGALLLAAMTGWSCGYDFDAAFSDSPTADGGQARDAAGGTGGTATGGNGGTGTGADFDGCDRRGAKRDLFTAGNGVYQERSE